MADLASRPVSLDRISLLADIATRLLMEERPEQIAREIYTRLAAHLDLDLYLNYLVDEDRRSLSLVAWAGLSDAQLAPIRRIVLGQAVCGTVALTGAPMIVERIQASGDPMLDAARGFGARSYACHPLVGHRGLIGTLAFGSRKRATFTSDEVQLMATVTSQAAVAIERARLLDALSESERRLRAVLDVLPVAVFIADADGQLLDANAAANRLWGLSEGQAPARGGEYRGWWPTTGRPIQPDEWGAARAARDDVARIGDEMDVETFDGRRLTILNYALPIHDGDGRVSGAVSVDVDITQRKQAERALQEANARKDVFLATLAHELRNPLAPIRYALRLLDAGGETTQARAKGVIARQLGHLVRLVDDLLDVSRITRNKIELRRRPVTLQAIVSQAIECARPALEDAGHRWELRMPEEPVWLDADPDRLAQVLTNLLNNASRYTPAGGAISLVCRPESGRVVLSIKDNGIGIAADDLPHVFDLFTQAARITSSAYAGLGIGLALAKAFTELHGGVIKAESAGPGQGSEFSVTLPVIAHREGDRRAAVAAPRDIKAARALRILVVDDNLDAADMLQTALSGLGHDVRTAYDGPTAFQSALEYRPDVALLDIGLPGIDGYELARRMRREGSLAGVRLVAITGWGQDEDRRRAADAGFDEHLTKPADPAAIERLLATY